MQVSFLHTRAIKASFSAWCVYSVCVSLHSLLVLLFFSVTRTHNCDSCGPLFLKQIDTSWRGLNLTLPSSVTTGRHIVVWMERTTSHHQFRDKHTGARTHTTGNPSVPCKGFCNLYIRKGITNISGQVLFVARYKEKKMGIFITFIQVVASTD